MRRRSILLCGLALTLVLIIAFSFYPLPPASSVQSELSNDAVSAAVNEYQSELDAAWTDPSNSSRSVLTSAEIANNNIRDKLTAIGEPIVSAESTVEILGVEQDGDRITVSARISTTFIYGGKQGIVLQAW